MSIQSKGTIEINLTIGTYGVFLMHENPMVPRAEIVIEGSKIFASFV
jgi:hypothetical protein